MTSPPPWGDPADGGIAPVSAAWPSPASSVRVMPVFTDTGTALMALLRLGALGFRQQYVDLGPECSAGFLLARGELGDRGGIAQGGPVGVGFPVLECLHDGLARLGRGALQELRPRGQVGLEPGDGLLSPAGFGRVVER